jgi:hypothetical protein
MTAMTSGILEQIRQLSLAERRELVQVLLKEGEVSGGAPARRRTVADVAGKFRSGPNPNAKDHDRWFAEAILASKRGDGPL